MKQILLVASAEWRYWWRSHLALGSSLLFFALLVVTGLISAVNAVEQNHQREHHQNEAQQAFLSQPDRHPHRMVHYGHYVFRTSSPLAMFDPGLDSVTGQSIFLEGHRQNSAMFASSSASADLGGLSWLTPALVYQLFAPLLIVLLGHSAVIREREAGVLITQLAQGLKGVSLIMGKLVALLSFVALLLIPMMFSGVASGFAGEDFGAIFWMVLVYYAYLSIWSVLALWVSSVLQSRSHCLALLAAGWFTIALVLPSVAVNITNQTTPIEGKVATDLAMLSDMRELGDGHNANDPAFQKLRSDLLAEHKVERVEDLPVNFRGVVALQSEKKLTEVLNRYADKNMAAERMQEQVLRWFGLATPTLAIMDASRALSATDLAHYHRFLREAEALRYDFVQGLNQAYKDALSYEADINRNKDEQTWQAARVSSENWNVLDSFEFLPATTTARVSEASLSLSILLAWLLVLTSGLLWSGARLKP